jgi:SEC-C motif
MVGAHERYCPTTEDAVDLDDYYSAFYEVEIPMGISATRAWQGRIQPYRSDDDARNLLIAIEKGSSILCDQGFLHSGEENSTRRKEHWAKPFLVSMAKKFEVLILERSKPMHPVAFSLRPEISWHKFPGHPHLRADISLTYAGRTLHGLCVYSAADFIYDRNMPRIVQFADQVSGYLARHLVWERTRRLEDFAGHILYQPKAGELILDTEPPVQPRDALLFLKNPKCFPVKMWRGYWPGQSAPAGPQNHLATIRSTQECWCGSGKKYGLCHRNMETSLEVAAIHPVPLAY